MTPEQHWTAVDDYLADTFLPPDPVLAETLRASALAGLPPINVSPNQGKFLYLLALAQGARRVLEIGTLGGYSTIWLARALPATGHLVTLEFEPQHAAVAHANLALAGLTATFEVRVGPALASLAQLAAEGCAPFDFIFIDADKDNYPGYFTWALKFSRPGTVIMADNIVRQGAVMDAGSADPRVQGVRQFNALVAAESRVSATAIQTVGSKGYDGFAYMVVTAGPTA